MISTPARIAGALLVSAAIALSLPAAAAEIDSAKRADIRELIGAGGTRLSQQLADTAARSIASALRQRHPGLPERVIPELTRELTAVFEERAHAPGGLVDRIIAVYDRHFTHDEVRELIAFNRTPIGRKTLEVMPAIMGETLAAGQAWGQSLAPEVRRRVDAILKREGVAAPARKRND